MDYRVARTGTYQAIVALALTFSNAFSADFSPLSGTQAEGSARWSAAAGITTFRFDPGLLEELDLAVEGPTVSARANMPGEMGFSITPDQRLDLWAPNAAFDGFAAGRLRHTGRLVLKWPGGRLATDGFSLRPVAPDALELVDSKSKVLFRLDYIHTMLYPEEGRMTLWNMGVALSPWLAKRMGHPELAGFVIATAFTQTSLAIPTGAQTEGACTSPNWHDGETFLTDVELIGLGPSLNGVQTMAREDGVRVAVAGDATLRNTGTADVPWYPKFGTAPPETFEQYPEPYSRDQHPFLVWAMYRIVGGIPQQIGQSEVKHAFFAQNGDCSCGGANILWSAASAGGGLGCTDLYSRSTNDYPPYLGIREELPAFTGEFEQCGSMFALSAMPPGPCAEEFNGNTMDEFERRMVIAESELGIEGASYFFEAWYVVRDDVNIFNSMGHKPVVPELDATWTFPGGNFVQGPAIDSWLPPGTLGASEAHAREATDHGHYSLAVKVMPLEMGMYRYVYALMNYDFDPRFDSFALQIPEGAALGNVQYLDGDGSAANDWTSSTAGGRLTFSAPVDGALEWGHMATFVFETDQAPVEGVIELTAHEMPMSYRPLSLALTDTFYLEGFEN